MWNPICRLTLQGQWEINFFSAFGDYPIRTVNADEPVNWYLVDHVLDGTLDIIPNLRWLIPMALQGDVVGEIYVDPRITHQRG